MSLPPGERSTRVGDWPEALAWFDRWAAGDAAGRAAVLAELQATRPALLPQVQAMIDAERAAEAMPEADATVLRWYVPPPPTVPTLPDEQLAGLRLGAWELQHAIGRGGMGQVWLATRSDGLYSGRAAVKLLNAASLGTQAQARFAREGELLARLSHPHIAKLLDAGFTPQGTRYLVLEYVQGERLDQWCDARSLGVPERLRLFMQVCDAVGFAHANLVVHRDLKPANILLTKAGVVKLGDFGIADDLRYTQDLTATGVGLGTPSYMSPEQILGERLDFRSDQFALGIVLYQMLSGRKPFVEDASQSVLEKIRTAAPPPLTTGSGTRSGARLPHELLAIVDRCLEKRRQDRFQTPQDLVLALERFLSQRVDVNYHARLVLFLREHGFVSPTEAQAVLGPLSTAAPPSGASARQRAAQGVTRRLAAMLALFSAALLCFLAGLHLLRVGAPLPGVVPEGEAASRAGQLQILVDPWAEVYIDGQWVETTPFARPLRVRPGRRFIELHNPHYPTVRRVVDVAPEQTLALRVTLPEPAAPLPAPGPSGAPSGGPSAAPLTGASAAPLGAGASAPRAAVKEAVP